MSILFRTKGWLAVNQLARAWAGELPGAEKDPKRFEQDLAHLLLEDVANGRLDDAGPFVEGRRLGLRIVTPDFRAGFLEGRQILDALRSGGDAEFLGHRIVVMKEAALTFAQSTQSAATLLVAKQCGRLTDDGARRHDWNVDIIVRHIRSKSSEPNFASEAGTCAKKVRADQASHEAGHSARPTYYRQARDHA